MAGLPAPDGRPASPGWVAWLAVAAYLTVWVGVGYALIAVGRMAFA